LFIFLSKGLDGNDANGSVSVARFDKAEKALALEAALSPSAVDVRRHLPGSSRLPGRWALNLEIVDFFRRMLS